MNKLRQSLRRKKQPYVPEASRPHQWQADEEAVRKGKCSFPVRYLGHVEVEESRGMHVCEDAVQKLKATGKKSVKAMLWVSADGLRVVDDKTKGERLSHAVGCAFAACLERKQRREKECGVTASFDASRTSFTREGSFRVTTTSQHAEREDTMKQLQDKTKGDDGGGGNGGGGGGVGWGDVSTVTAGNSTFQPGHRRTPSEAERWLQEVAKTARAQQQQQQQQPPPAPLAPTAIPVPTGLPASASPFIGTAAPVNLFGPPPAFVTYAPGLTNGTPSPYPAPSVPVVGITPSQMVANVFGSAQQAPLSNQGFSGRAAPFAPAFGITASSTGATVAQHQARPPRPLGGASVPSRSGVTMGPGAWPPEPSGQEADQFEAQWAALEAKSQARLGAALPTNPFSTDLQKTFEIQL
ncbi:hypothetical protein chiPu_0013277 [Chiloscyllium punctatum]|uniref:PID domain-containing protein n=1 Tax=Chiloscyllium punctatum TaxID=137246 RepID=A0A401SWQ5_CHIPU|nr:hypothetical protein [Chiloscyllium punctatum]